MKEIQVSLFLDESVNRIKVANITPTDMIYAIRYENGKFLLSAVNWGIKFRVDSPLIFNSRIESIKEKKFGYNLFDKNRCIVPMTGFYEWKKEGTRKVPYRISLHDKEIFYVPALFNVDKEKNINTSLITTTPNKFIKQIHHRMPVILDLNTAVNYLKNDAAQNLELCLPYDDSNKMEAAKTTL